MKKVILAAAVVFAMLSCSVSEEVVRTNFENYSDFSTENFFVSPYGYNGDYKAIGMINFEIIPEASNENAESNEDLLKKAIELAKEKGANGLMNCKCDEGTSVEYKKVVHTHANYAKKAVYKKSYTFSGLAIKINAN